MILNIVSVANSIKSTKVKRPSRKTNFKMKRQKTTRNLYDLRALPTKQKQ